MKKLSLNKLSINPSDELHRNNLKTIIGGYNEGGVASCSATCDEETIVTCSGNNCEATDYEGCSSDNGSKSCNPAA